MTLNPVFIFHEQSTEQDIIEQIVTEAIQIHGMDMYYLPRTGINTDEILHEDQWSEYNSAYLIEMYVKNFEGFAGDGQLLAKFGLEIRDQITLTVSKSRFKEEIGDVIDYKEPHDADIVYIPKFKAAYKITYVDPVSNFYTLGSLYSYDLKLDLLEYSRDKFNTGILEIDEKYNQYTLSDQDIPISEDDASDFFDLFADNTKIQDAAEEILDLSETNPFGANE